MANFNKIDIKEYNSSKKYASSGILDKYERKCKNGKMS